MKGIKNQEIERAIMKVFDNRLAIQGNNINKIFPSILRSKRYKYALLPYDKFLLFTVLTYEEFRKFDELRKKKYFPFPGLIKNIYPKQKKIGAAVKVNKVKYFVFSNNKISNLFVFDLGKDSSVIIENLKVEISTKELGPYSYEIALAYIIIFGDIFNSSNIIDVFDDLVAYSVSKWRESK